ncbi:MAG: universal stress protein [Thermodesulfobacteriota bacterium]|jgi:nucleotide-binding universal stress UspA family protein|nr:MAG: universal stress protein [Thermodesulfobacteriota bacterium]
MEIIVKAERKILWASDFSEMSIEALKTTQVLSFIPQQELIALHIIENPMDNLYKPEDSVPINRLTHAEDIVKEKFKKIFEEFGIAPKFYRIEVLTIEIGKHAGDKIIEVADKEKVWLIIMGREAKGMKRLLGSTTEYVLAHAKCPILIVRGKIDEEIFEGHPRLK